MSRKSLRKLISPFLSKSLLKSELETNWHRKEALVSLEKFGEGNVQHWSWYFTGESKVEINSIDDLCGWLQQCDYILDDELFIVEDFWQHPLTFEHTRKGDCEDQSLWAWRQMASLGIDSEFVVGWIDEDSTELEGHAWVQFEYDGIKYIFESTGDGKEGMLLLFDEYNGEYIPEFAVDLDFRTYVYKHGLECL